MTDGLRDVQLAGELPTLVDPVLIVMLQGWIDAAGSAHAAMEAVEGQIDPIPVASFDPDVFIDFRARRPVMQIREGRNDSIEFPSIDLYGGHDLDGRDVLYFVSLAAAFLFLNGVVVEWKKAE